MGALVRTAGEQGGFYRTLLAAIGSLLAAVTLLPPPWAALIILGAVILLGVPHGALDGEIARGLLVRRFGRLWFPVFAAPYLTLAALVLMAWQVAPMATLAGFLALSVWHFGAEDSGGTGDPVEILARGGLPVAVPTMAHPVAVAVLFSPVTATSLAQPPVWLLIASLSWLPLALFWLGRTVARGSWRPVVEAAGLAAAFIFLPTLVAFGLYFVCVHAPRHMRALVADPYRAPRVDSIETAIVLSLPVTGLTLLIGGALWPLYAGPPPERLLALTLQGLAALTLPHLILDGLASRAARSLR